MNDAMMIGLFSGLFFCVFAWWVGPAKCYLCRGRGVYEVTETFESYEMTKPMRCPRGCALRP